jgi:hypothetical protein
MPTNTNGTGMTGDMSGDTATNGMNTGNAEPSGLMTGAAASVMRIGNAMNGANTNGMSTDDGSLSSA